MAWTCPRRVAAGVEAAREKLLVKEKELTHARDALAAERRRMPRMAVEKEYAFEGPNGPASLLDMFEGRRQLIVYRFFYEPGVDGWPDKGCPGCSLVADQVAHPAHLNARDTTLAFVSRAPQAEDRAPEGADGLGDIPWYTLTDDFDTDFGVAEWHGTNAFIRDDEDRIFRTYFIDSRGDEAMGGTWAYLDITALGRQEDWEDSPEGYPQTATYDWWRRHDEYDDPTAARGRGGGRAGRARPGRGADEDRALMFFAHLGGVPVEEALLPLLSGWASAALVLARAWLGTRLRRGRR